MKRLISSFLGGFIISFCPFWIENFYLRNNIFLKITAAVAVICAVYCGCSLIFTREKPEFKNILAVIAGIIFAVLLL